MQATGQDQKKTNPRISKQILCTFGMLLLLTSCFLRRDFRKESFTYSDASGTKTVTLLLPDGWNDVDNYTDSSGSPVKIYHYGKGAYLYITHGSGSRELQEIDASRNIPRPHVQGGFFVKGQDSAFRFWREVRLNGLRFGYRHVPYNREGNFDSALNFIKPR